MPTSAVMIVAVKADTWADVFDGKFEHMEGYAWSPNKSHRVENSDVKITALEGVVGLETVMAPRPTQENSVPDFLEITIRR